MKKSLLVHYDYKEQFSLLSNAEFGSLIRSAIDYERDGVIPEFSEKHLSLAFSVIKENIDRNMERYQKRCEQNRQNIQKRWEKEGG